MFGICPWTCQRAGVIWLCEQQVPNGQTWVVRESGVAALSVRAWGAGFWGPCPQTLAWIGSMLCPLPAAGATSGLGLTSTAHRPETCRFWAIFGHFPTSRDGASRAAHGSGPGLSPQSTYTCQPPLERLGWPAGPSAWRQGRLQAPRSIPSAGSEARQQSSEPRLPASS